MWETKQVFFNFVVGSEGTFTAVSDNSVRSACDCVVCC